jgi:hypothetical protein
MEELIIGQLEKILTMVEDLQARHPPGKPVRVDDPGVKAIEKAFEGLNANLKTYADDAMGELKQTVETMKAQHTALEAEQKARMDAFNAAEAAAAAKAEKAKKLTEGVPVVVLLGDTREHYALRFEKEHTPAETPDVVTRLLDLARRQTPPR